MSRVVTSLCSIPSFGTFGTPTFFGGPIGTLGSSAPLTDAEIAALGNRANVPTGTTLTNHADLVAGWAFTAGLVVWFDGYAALYGLSRHAPAADFSASFWFNPYEESSQDLTGPQKYGVIFGNSSGTLAAAPDAEQTTAEFRLHYTSNPPTKVAGMDMPGIHNHTADPNFPLDIGWTINSSAAPGFTTDPVDEMQGWCHIMYSHKVVSGQPDVTIYVNDTAIVSHYFPPDTNTLNGGNRYNDETWLFPWDVPTLTSFDSTQCPWTVGGLQVYSFDPSIGNSDFTLPAGDCAGKGLIGAMTELWIAPGQYIDWSVQANRKKFHNSDVGQTIYSPCDIGSKGATPTGTKPQYYFTGPPSKFFINRSTGSNARVFHRGAPFGLVDVLRDYGVVP